MTDREKLVGLLDIIIQPGQKTLGDIADYLLANGVTFATDTKVGGKWIPVSERLPEEHTNVWVYRPKMAVKYMTSYFANENMGFCDGAMDIKGNKVITHWRPLPEPPKEGE